MSNHFLIKYLYKEYITYPVFCNLNYFWNFGVLSFFFLSIQIVTGILLAMHYQPTADLAFLSIEHIMRDINLGWLIRYVHANGASFFFSCVYLHILRNVYYMTYITPRELVWIIGMLIFILMILTAFLGYVSPWGQMSFWAATVITSLFSIIPLYGESIVIWLWGGFAVDEATLNRFLSLHYVFPFIIIALVFLHVLILHESGSSNPVGISLYFDKSWFNPYYTKKDLYSVILISILFCFFIFFNPNYLGHTDNYIMANPLSTPAHIVPEWYFLPFYAILRSIPDKAGGIIVLAVTLFLLLILPYTVSNIYKNITSFSTLTFNIWIFILLYLLLGWLGGQPIEYPYIILGQVLTFFYLCYILFIFDGIFLIESMGCKFIYIKCYRTYLRIKKKIKTWFKYRTNDM